MSDGRKIPREIMIVGFIVTSIEKAMSWTMIVFSFVEGEGSKEGRYGRLSGFPVCKEHYQRHFKTKQTKQPSR